MSRLRAFKYYNHLEILRGGIMENNIGKVDLAIRTIIGVVALYLAFMYNVWWLVVSLIAFVTVYRKKCALYSILGISTAAEKKEMAKMQIKSKSKKKK